MKRIALISFIQLFLIHCKGQTNTAMSNPLLCNPDSGVCEIPANAAAGNVPAAPVTVKPIRIIYYTDPICSSCWGIEPQLRKLKLEYGHLIETEYRMGGLLPDWSYNSGGISKPADVAHHWDEVSVYYDMPIDGDVWLEDPLPSSYPPSIAFKAAQMQDKNKAIRFLRELREMVFLKKKNIAKWEHINQAAEYAGLNTVQLKADYEGKAVELFHEDLKLARSLGVRGFPTLFFADSAGRTEIVYGSKPYAAYEQAILKINPAAKKATFDKDWKFLFSRYKSLTAKEFAELSGTARPQSEAVLQQLADKGTLEVITTKNGKLWQLKETTR